MARAKTSEGKPKGTGASTSAGRAPRKRGKAARLADLAATLDAATGIPDTNGINGHATPSHGTKLVVVPRKGPGRRRLVPANSIDGIAATLATELAADLLDKCRDVADRMVREAVANILPKRPPR